MDASWEVSAPKFLSSDVATLIGLAAKAMPVRVEIAGASALHILLFSFNPDNATGIGIFSAELC